MARLSLTHRGIGTLARLSLTQGHWDMGTALTNTGGIGTLAYNSPTHRGIGAWLTDTLGHWDMGTSIPNTPGHSDICASLANTLRHGHISR